MKRKAKAEKSYLSRTSKNEILFAKIAIATVSFVLLLVGISLGTRTNSLARSTVKKQIEQTAQYIRGWQASSEPDMNSEKSDLRSHVGFHFDWPTRFNTPQLSLPKATGVGRTQEIEQLLKLGKTKTTLRATNFGKNRYYLEETLSRNDKVQVKKSVAVLLPGEKIQIYYNSSTAAARNWKLRVRAIAVTQDRLDSTIPVLTGFSREILTRGEVEPRGQQLDIDIPSASELQRRDEKYFTIEWPTEASGILVLEGLQPAFIDSENRSQMSRNLVVHIDGMHGSLTQLQRTLELLNRSFGNTANKIHITSAIPPAKNFSLSRETLLTGRTPIELGASLQNDKLRQLIKPQQTLVNKAINRGGSARKITLASKNSCSSDCLTRSGLTAENEFFTSEMTITRNDEFASTSLFIRNDEFITEPGLLFVEINAPSENLRLNWESITTSKFSTYRWITSGLLDIFGYKDSALQNEEKILQIDIWLAKLIESFLVNSHSANIAIFLHDNDSPVLLSGSKKETTSLTRGEILMNLHDLSMTTSEPKQPTVIETPVGMLSALRFFEKKSVEKKTTLTHAELLQQLNNEHMLVSQLQESSYITTTPDGWLLDPKHSSGQDENKPLFKAEPEKIHLVQESSNTERRKSKLLGLHVSMPANNLKDEVIDTEISTTLRGLGCESQSENAQLKSFNYDAAGIPSLSEMQIVGRRAAQTPWHIFCLFEGRISNSTSLRMRFELNDRPVVREMLGLGEFALPIRGFLWRSPDSIELIGAQVLDATVSLHVPDSDLAKQTSVVLWSDRIPAGLKDPRATFPLELSRPEEKPLQNSTQEAEERLSEK